MLIKKITTGFVTQVFDTEKKQYISQDFTAGDVEYERVTNSLGESPFITDTELVKFGFGPNAENEPYLPFEMVQPPSVNRCAVCGETAITTRNISINDAPKQSLPVCQIHADAADEDKEV